MKSSFWHGTCQIGSMALSFDLRKTHIYRLMLAGLLALLLLTFATPQPPQAASLAEKEALWEAYQQRYDQVLAINAAEPLASLFEPFLDEAFISPDGQIAVLWLGLRDYSGRALATEPGIVLASMEDKDWQALLRGDPGWEQALARLPEGFLPAEFSSSSDQTSSPNAEPIRGYYLPWVKGIAHKLEGSILHFYDFPALGYPSCSQSACQYAYDFTDSGHFPMVAA